MAVTILPGLSPEQQKIVLDLLQLHLPGVVVWAYGSRMRGTANAKSDLDLVVFAGPKKNSRSSASGKLSTKAICRSVSICSTGANCPKISEITSKPGIWF